MRMLQDKTKLYFDLIDVIEKQDNVISKQNQTIVNLVNENLEKENMINILMQEQEGMY